MGHKYGYIEYAFTYQEHTLTNAQLSFSRAYPLSITHTQRQATLRGPCLEGPPSIESPCGSWLIPSQVNTTMTSSSSAWSDPICSLSGQSGLQLISKLCHSSNKTQRRSAERQGQSDSRKDGHLPHPLSLIAVILGVSSMWFLVKGVRVNLLHFRVFLFLLGGVRSWYNKFKTVYYFKTTVSFLCDWQHQTELSK